MLIKRDILGIQRERERAIICCQPLKISNGIIIRGTWVNTVLANKYYTHAAR